MVEDTEAVAEIHAVVGQRHAFQKSRVEAHVGKTREAFLRNRQCLGAGIDAMEPTYARRDEASPTPASTAGIETHGVAGQAVPGKGREIFREHPPQLRAGNAALVEATPFPTEIIDGCPIEIW